jgi:PAS domain S-box-containing protein
MVAKKRDSFAKDNSLSPRARRRGKGPLIKSQPGRSPAPSPPGHPWAEEAFRTELAFRQALENSILAGIAAFDLEGRQIYANPAFCKMVGWTQDELIGNKPPFVYWPADFVPALSEIFLRIFTEPAPQGREEVLFQRKGGTRFPALVLYSILRNSRGEKLGWVLSVEDITEIKRKEEEIRRLNAELEERVRLRTAELEAANAGLEKARDAAVRKRRYLKTVLDTIPSGVIVTHQPDGRITYVNRRGLELYRGSSSLRALLPADLRQIKLETETGDPFPPNELPVYQAMRKGENIRFVEIQIERSDQSRVTVSVNASPLRDETGKVIGAVGSFHDITRRKAAEDEIKRLNEDLRHRTYSLEAANRELKSFTSSVAHDLRTPLIIMGTYSQRLLKKYAKRLDKKGQGYLDQLLSTTQKMEQIIEALMKLSLVSRAEIHWEKVNLSEISGTVMEELRRLEPLRPLDCSIPQDLFVMGDPPLLKIMMENLLRNAWKFTRQSSPALIELGVLPQGPDRAFFVRDNGCGFDMAQAQKIFEPFTRLHNKEEVEGSGIGLATVKRVIDRHGGKIWSESKPGRGATFYFTLESRQSL